MKQTFALWITPPLCPDSRIRIIQGKGKDKAEHVVCSISGQGKDIAIPASGWQYFGGFCEQLHGKSHPHWILSTSQGGDGNLLLVCPSTEGWGCQSWGRSTDILNPAECLHFHFILGSTNHEADLA